MLKAKRLLALVLFSAILVCAFPQRVEANENPEGYISDVESVVVSNKAFEEMLDDTTARISKNYLSFYSAAESYWSRFESDYYYKKLSPRLKTLYDQMYYVSMAYLTGSANIPDGGNNDSKKDYYMTFDGTGLTRDDVNKIVYVFLNSNPQFFFLNGSGIELYYSSVGAIKGFSFNLYEEYKNGSVRSSYVSRAKTKLDSWLAQIPSSASDYDKAKIIYNLVARNLVYDNDAYYSGDTEKIGRHQSTATALFTGVSVCAGYAELYGMLAAASGLECITVTSYDHEWNQVKIGDSWYCLDVTWDDNGDGAGNYYFLKNDSFFRRTGHVPENYYRDIRPECYYDWSGSRGTGENEPEIKKTYSITYVNGYTNESNPKNYTKGETVYLENPTRKGYKFKGWYENSDFSGSKVTRILPDDSGDKKLYGKWEAIKYKIKFYKNGGKGSMTTLVDRKYGKTYKLPANKFTRKGYKFKGWAKTPNGKVVYKNKASVKNLTSTDGKTVKLYARWAKK